MGKPLAVDRFELVRLACVHVHDPAPSRVLMILDGRNDRLDGTTFHLDADAAASIIRNFESRPDSHRGVLIDYEHQSMGGDFAAPDGKVREAGRINKLEYVPGRGLFADVKWSVTAGEEIAAQEYNYLSPVVLVRKDNRKATTLINAALTNQPAIIDMPPLTALANAERIIGDLVMADMPGDGAPTQDELIAKLKAALGLEEGDAVAVLQAAIAKLAAMTEAPTEEAVASSVAKKAGLEARSIEELVACIGKLKTSDGDKDLAELKQNVEQLTVTNKSLAEQVATERKARQAMEAEKVVNAERHKGKMSKSEADLHVKRLKDATDFDAAVKDFEALMNTRPVILNQHSVIEGAAGDEGASGGRQSIINSAKSEYATAGTAMVATLETYVNGALREKGLPTLTDDEKTKLVA